LHAERAKKFAASFQFFVEPLQHAQAKLAIAFNRDNLRVRQTIRRVALELDTLLEVHEIKLHLLRAAPKREVRDDDMEQRRFAGASLARDERVLARAFANGEILEFGRTAASDG